MHRQYYYPCRYGIAILTSATVGSKHTFIFSPMSFPLYIRRGDVGLLGAGMVVGSGDLCALGCASHMCTRWCASYPHTSHHTAHNTLGNLLGYEDLGKMPHVALWCEYGHVTLTGASVMMQTITMCNTVQILHTHIPLPALQHPS